MEGSPPATIRAVSSAQWSLVVTTTKAEEFELGLVTSRQCFSLQSIFLIYRNLWNFGLALRGIFFRLTETPVNKSKLCWYRSEMIHTVVWRIYFSETRFDFSDIPTSK